MAAIRDYYRVLGVRRSATPAEIKAAFRRKAQLLHPDHNPGREEWANRRLVAVVEAYEVLCNPEARAALDRELRLSRRKASGDTRLSKPDDINTNRIIVDIMRHRATPSWARSLAFAYVFMKYYTKGS